MIVWHISGDLYDHVALQAYQALMVLTIRDFTNTQRYKNFVKAVKVVASRDFPEMKVVFSYYVTAFYDAVILYAISINKTRERGQSIDRRVNYRNLSTVQWNLSFPGNENTSKSFNV